MGIADFLKKLFPPGKNPLLALEPQCLRHVFLTLRLPQGWQFTGHNDSRMFKATGPGGAAAELSIAPAFNQRVEAKNAEQNRAQFVKVMRDHVFKGRKPSEEVLSTGVLWMEAKDVQGGNERLEVVLFHPQSRSPERLGQPTRLQITCTLPQGSADAAFRAERFEALRAALRAVEWN